jgi:hypothetical protein
LGKICCFAPHLISQASRKPGCAGVCLFNAFLRKIELQALFLWLALAGAGARLTQLLLVTGAAANFVCWH